MKVILSIKPEYTEKIFNGTKKYEFRRSLFKNPNVDTIIVYASSPIKKVVGEFKIQSIINDKLSDLWEKTKNYSGISKEYFFDYFSNKQNGYAIQIEQVKKYQKPLCIKKDFNMAPPQSFAYIN